MLKASTTTVRGSATCAASSGSSGHRTTTGQYLLDSVLQVGTKNPVSSMCTIFVQLSEARNREELRINWADVIAVSAKTHFEGQHGGVGYAKTPGLHSERAGEYWRSGDHFDGSTTWRLVSYVSGSSTSAEDASTLFPKNQWRNTTWTLA